MLHIATTNYAFCAGLKDTTAPQTASPGDKDGIVKLPSDSFEYCAGVKNALSDEQVSKPHDSPDGRMRGASSCSRCTYMWQIIAGTRRFICATKVSSRRRTRSETKQTTAW